MKILLAEDQSMLRDALSQLLQLQPDVASVSQAADGREAIELLKTNPVDVAILGCRDALSDRAGCSRMGEGASASSSRLIIVTTFKRPGYFERAVKADVDAYVLKERSIADLMKPFTRSWLGRKNTHLNLWKC